MSKNAIDLEEYKIFIDHFIDKYSPNIDRIRISTNDLAIEIEMSDTRIGIFEKQPTEIFHEE